MRHPATTASATATKTGKVEVTSTVATTGGVGRSSSLGVGDGFGDLPGGGNSGSFAGSGVSESFFINLIFGLKFLELVYAGPD